MAGAAAGASPGPEFLAASTTIDPGDPQVAALAREAIGEATDPWDQAQRLTRWVTAHMTFDAGIAFAPAAELARDRHGTCAGYAVLLASLLRAANIPARLDLGLAYTNGIFGGHAWVEAFLRGRWVPLDAALPSDGPADAARIPLARDAADRGPGAAMSSFGQVVGRAKIRVVGYTPGGRTPGAGGAGSGGASVSGGGAGSGGASVSGGGGAGSSAVRTDDATAPYAIDGARYTNRGLGLTVTRPADAQFASADAVWPDRTLVAVERAGARVAILETA
ncbi:MAG TPA: transglutaminase-like domain-containing protein, partial [Kofleriaceae bacterium]|nr:transglutaminase-like domain-containing protein [Kofleriaceae bacterium]